MARKYTQKNTEYWQKRNKSFNAMASAAPEREFSAQEQEMMKPKMVGPQEVRADWYNPQAATRAYERGGIGGGWNGMGGTWNGPQFRFPNVYQGILPYQSVQSASWIGLPDAIELCQKAYANIAVVGNAIETQVEFSCSEIHLKCKNKTALKSCQNWLDRIDINSFQEQFYREFYRSANVFIYRVYGKLNQDMINELNTKYGFAITKKEIVVGYIILNPVNVAVRNAGIGLYQSYVKFLTSIELAALQNSEFGREMLKQLGVTNDQLNKAYPQVYLEFDTTKLVPIFNRKQSYEPLSVPPLWSLMDDLEIKLKMKRADESVLITVEKIILLITHGAKKEDGGMNPLNHAALTSMFTNTITNRVLVADYTTEAKFVVPDLKGILGIEKYAQVDKDIKEGLATIFIGGQGDKFSNQMTQVKMFLKKLEGARKKFKRFLETELESFCDALGFRDLPTVELEDVNLEDDVQYQKLIAMLMQLGILTPEHGLPALQDGILPTQDENVTSQEAYKKLRDKGLFLPLNPNGNAGGANLQSGRPAGKGSPQSKPKKPSVLGEEQNAEINDEDKISIKSTVEIMKKINNLYSHIIGKLRMGHKKNVDEKSELVQEVVMNVIYNAKIKDWKEEAAKIIDSKFEHILDNKEIQGNIKNLEKDLLIDKYLAAVIFHSKELGL